MVDGEDRTTLRPLRPAAPPDGPFAGSGAAPDEPFASVPRPRRPWLRSATPSADDKAAHTDDDPPHADDTAARTDDTAARTDDTAARTDDTAARTDGPAGTAPPRTGDDLTVTRVDPLPPVDPAAPDRPAAARRRRVPFAHAVRIPPGRLAAGATRAVRDWSRRPSGRLTLPGVFLLFLVAATAAAGALLVPAAVRSRPVAVDASAGAPTTAADPTLAAGAPLPATTLPPLGGPTAVAPTGGTVVPAPGTGRPADALAAWAAQIGPKVGIAPVAMQAYGYAELVLAQTNRSCGLSWTTLAAIGHVESAHGQANGARLGTDGRAAPEIIGLPLDGRDNRMLIRDTDRGVLDRDTTYDRAIGPMQFIPTTWQEVGADADNDGRKDPHDIDDAALAAANYLCKGSRNLTIAGDWWNAILSYNDVRAYAQDVFDRANQYGQASRT
ncbi:lytic murein transglycosylase [Micromonospora sp. WMMD558]|uniref:lytic murein transglycosylase n=1 Tax=unclassified Micromonospora TaxID=2617518 RepID=UPI0012B4B6A7|nr:lytic murein transglycosylase [Micromonospora sp. WMMC415]QGN46704.1 transglycosylase SLT domain-containing protein [Micromonospora sp. WMMC415]